MRRHSLGVKQKPMSLASLGMTVNGHLISIGRASSGNKLALLQESPDCPFPTVPLSKRWWPLPHQLVPLCRSNRYSLSRQGEAVVPVAGAGSAQFFSSSSWSLRSVFGLRLSAPSPFCVPGSSKPWPPVSRAGSNWPGHLANRILQRGFRSRGPVPNRSGPAGGRTTGHRRSHRPWKNRNGSCCC